VFKAPKRPSRLNPNIPPWLDAVLLRAIARDPQRRYQNFSQLAFDLTHPEKVEDYHDDEAPLLERNPLLFYKTAFYILFFVTLWLLLKLLAHPG